MITVSGGVLFASNQYTLLNTATTRLDRIAKALFAQDDDNRYVVEGHTDSSGSEAINQPLSLKRAVAVRNHLVSRGVDTIDHSRRAGVEPTGRRQQDGRQLSQQPAGRGRHPGWGGTTDEMLVIRRETLRSLWTAETSAPDHARLVAQDAGGQYGYDPVAWGTQGELLYTLTESENADIWGIETATLRRRRLTTDPADDYHPCVSPDGETVVFASNRGGLPGLWAMARDGSQPRRLTTGGDAYPSFSPDGTWVAFQRSGVESTPWAVYRVFLRTGEVAPITVPSTMRPAVSPDGRFVAHYWMTPERWAMAVTPVEGGVPTRTFGLRPTHSERYIRWAPDGTALAYIDMASGASNLWLQPLPEGPPRMLTNFTEGSIATFDWSRDGASLAFMRVTEVADVVAIDLGPSPRP